MATTTAVRTATESADSTVQDRIDLLEGELAKAESAVARLRSELRTVPARVRTALAQLSEDGEPGRAAAEQQLLALRERRSELPALIAVAEVVAAGGEVALRELEQQAADGAYLQARASEDALQAPPGVFMEASPRTRQRRAMAASRCEATGYARQAAADHFEKARARVSAALSVTLE